MLTAFFNSLLALLARLATAALVVFKPPQQQATTHPSRSSSAASSSSSATAATCQSVSGPDNADCMPPKKRTATTATTKAKKPKASHTASATTTADMIPKTGSRPKSARNAPVAADSTGFNAKKCAAWFQSYEDPDEEGMVGPEGMEKLCSDLGIELASIEILIIAWRLGAQNMGYFKKSEWLDGMKKLEVDSTDSLAKLLPSLARIYDSPSEFKELYMFAFAFAKEEDQKSLSIEHAQGMWQILCPPDRFEHIEPFLRFIAEKHPVKVVNKDQWRSFIEFSNVVDGDLAGYDESSAWPVLFDDYVAWRRAQKKE